jgi:hypothetical protein
MHGTTQPTDVRTPSSSPRTSAPATPLPVTRSTDEASLRRFVAEFRDAWLSRAASRPVDPKEYGWSAVPQLRGYPRK